MTDEDSDKQLPRPRGAPGVVAPSNRVVVAFPFSSIHVESRTKDLDELAALVRELIVHVEEGAPSEEVSQLRERADALIARLE